MIEESSCASNPCPERAMCKDEPGPGNYTCLCRSGYTGENCDLTVDPCIGAAGGNPCQNDGLCESYQQVSDALSLLFDALANTDQPFSALCR